MAAALSVTASAFAVVGLADVVFRSGKELCGALVAIERAPHDIQALRSELQDLEAVIANIRAFATEYSTSHFQVDDQPLLPNIEQLLLRCQREFRNLQGILNTVGRTQLDGWFGQLGKSAGWVRQQSKITTARQVLKGLSIALVAALSLAGRQNDIIIRNELQAVRTDNAATRSDYATRLLRIGQSIDSSNTASQQSFSDARALMQANFVLTSKRLDGGFSSMNQSLQRTREQQEDAATRISAQLQGMQLCLTRHFEAITAVEAYKHSVDFDGTDLGAIVWPLSIVKRALLDKISIQVKEGILNVTHDEFGWAHREMELFIAAGHDAAAKAVRARTLCQKEDGGKKFEVKRAKQFLIKSVVSRFTFSVRRRVLIMCEEYDSVEYIRLFISFSPAQPDFTETGPTNLIWRRPEMRDELWADASTVSIARR